MKKMKKVLSLVLVLIMVLSLFPVSAFAEFNGMLGSIWEPGEDIEPLPLPTTLPEVEEPEEEEAVLFDSVEQTFYVEDENGVAVDVEAPAGALPMGADLVVSSVAPETIQADVDALLGAESNVLLAMDISFVDEDGNEVHPAADVKVMLSGGALADKENLQVVHFPDETLAPELVNQLDANDVAFEYGTNVAFQSKDFSVYAVIGVDDYRIATVKFMRGEEEVATMYVKEGDTRDQLNAIIYDPGAGAAENGVYFRGWTTDANYTVKTEPMTIDQVRQALYDRTIVDGETITYYAMLFRSFSVTYIRLYGDTEMGLGADEVMIPVNATNAQAEYTIGHDYTPDSGKEKFEGWMLDADSVANVVGGSATAVYKVNDTITITGSITLVADVAEGAWLRFEEGGNGATYVAPVFVYHEDNTVCPTRVMERRGYTFDDWYVDSSFSAKFEFGHPLTEPTTVYAKWDKNETAPYSVIIWLENLDGTGYDYKESIPGTAASDAVLNSTDASNPGVTVVTVVGTIQQKGSYARINGTNKQYDGFQLDHYDQNVTNVAEGGSVVNVYYKRSTYTFTFTRDYFYYGNLIVHEVTRRYGADIKDIWTFDGSDGVHYPQTSPATSWHPTGSSTYTARITRMEIMPAEDITFYHETSDNPERKFYYYVEALPGQTGDVTYQGKEYVKYTDDTCPLTHNFYYVFYKDDFWDLTGFTQYRVLAGNNANLDNRTDITTRLKNAADGGLGWENRWNSTMTFLYTRDSGKITYLDGSYYTGRGVRITTQASAGELHKSGDILYNADISSYFDKTKSDYYVPTLTGNAADEFVFEGWYIDKDGTTKATSENVKTMPDGGVTVYAKWVQKEYRVFLRPNVPQDCAVNGESRRVDWGDTAEKPQEMNFRIAYGAKVSSPNGRSDNYEFLGWYTDESYNNPFDSEMKFTSDIETEANLYDMTDPNYYTDPMDRFGEGATYNKDATGNDIFGDKTGPRFWITHMYEIYGKWSAKLVGALGINVEYDGAGGSNVPSDSHLYKDNTSAVAQSATNPSNTATTQFLYWNVQTWNGTEYVDTDTHVYPGETFTVYKANARDVDTGEVDENNQAIHTYTVRLRAVYGPKEAPTPTHITWYDNFTENPSSPANYVTVDDLQINKAIEIQSSTLFSRPGYRFLGWARVATTDAQGNALADNGLKPRELGVSDLYLTWHDADTAHPDYPNGYYTVKYNNDDKVVTQVAADENFPYHDMYAVWGAVYYVYHTGSGRMYAYDVGTPVTKEMFFLNETNGHIEYSSEDWYLYGGYSMDFYAGFTASDTRLDQAKNDATVAMKTNTYTTPSDLPIYNPTGAFYKPKPDYVKWWKSMGDTAYTSLAPTGGQVIFVKEVPKTYLTSRIQFVYENWAKDENGNNEYKLQHVYLMSVLDDRYYQEGRFKIIESTTEMTISSTFSFKSHSGQEGSTPEIVTTKASDFGVSYGFVGNALGNTLLADHREGDYYVIRQSGDNTFTMIPQWITIDGVTVTGTARTFTFGDFTSDGVKSDDDSYKYATKDSIKVYTETTTNP